MTGLAILEFSEPMIYPANYTLNSSKIYLSFS